MALPISLMKIVSDKFCAAILGCEEEEEDWPKNVK